MLTFAPKIVADTAGIGRGLRDARHDINAFTADLLAIKLALDIARDDFSSANASLPPLLIEAASEMMDCCSTATGGLHKLIVRLSASEFRKGLWQALKEKELIGLRHDLQAVRCALDLLLDLVDLYVRPQLWRFVAKNKHSFTEPQSESEVASPNRRSFFDDTDPEVWLSFLERVDIERMRINKLVEGRLPSLQSSLDKLRRCIDFQVEERPVSETRPKGLKLQTDATEPHASYGLYGAQDKSLPSLPSPLSVSGGIGAWIANVVSQALHSPATHPPSIISTNLRSTFADKGSDERAPSRETFYAESIASGPGTGTSGIHTLSSSDAKSQRSRNRQKVDSPQLTQKEARARSKQSVYPIAPTIIGSERSIIHHKLTNDKIAVARDTRRQLTKDQRAALDWILKNISSNTTPSEVEQILWEGADPNATDIDFGYLIIRAAYAFSVPVLELLVEYGADIMRTSYTVYHSTIHAAVLGKRLQNVQWLVEMGIPFDAPNLHGETPLHLAVKTPGGYQIAKWLLEMGADVNKETVDGTTPFQMVLSTTKVDAKERSMMVELLLAQGADGELSPDSTLNRGKGLSVLGLI